MSPLLASSRASFHWVIVRCGKWKDDHILHITAPCNIPPPCGPFHFPDSNHWVTCSGPPPPLSLSLLPLFLFPPLFASYTHLSASIRFFLLLFACFSLLHSPLPTPPFAPIRSLFIRSLSIYISFPFAPIRTLDTIRRWWAWRWRWLWGRTGCRACSGSRGAPRARARADSAVAPPREVERGRAVCFDQRGELRETVLQSEDMNSPETPLET